MKKILCLLPIMISGCFSDTTDIRLFIDNTKKNTISSIEPMAKVPEFKHIEYMVNSKSNPFVLPTPKFSKTNTQQNKNCVNPDEGREKEVLEKYALDTLHMRGTLGILDVSWALIETPDNTVHRIKKGNFIGLNHGQITKVNDKSINILELVPDATGCWVQRESTVDIMDASSTGARN